VVRPTSRRVLWPGALETPRGHPYFWERADANEDDFERGARPTAQGEGLERAR